MKSRPIFFISALFGIACGLISTHPFALGPILSFGLWGFAGIVIGFLVHGNKEAVWSGSFYGLFLSVSFLFSRFGGTADKILGYSIFVAWLSIFGIFCGGVTVFVGSKLKILFAK